MYRGRLRTKTREIKQKYCLAYRQGTIGIGTAEIKGMPEGEPEPNRPKKSSGIAQKKPDADENLSLSKTHMAAWENYEA